MEAVKIRCDHDNFIELRVINGELNVTVIATDGDRKTAPISRKENADELMLYLESLSSEIRPNDANQGNLF